MRYRIVTLLVLVSFATAAQPRATATTSFQPTFETVPCPDILAPIEGSKISCGYLTVLENRADPNGRTIRLFVLIGEPLEGDPPPDPVFSPGRDLVLTRPALARPCLGAFIGRVCILMDERGTGFSQPNLSCPEVEELTDPSFGVTLGTPEMDAALLDAVQACHVRLTAQGIDLGAYNLAEMAADAEDLRVTLGIDEWNLMTWGTSSAISFEIMRRYPDHVRAAAFDSPSPPQVDRFTEAVVGTQYALGEVIHACRAQRSCAVAFPHLRRTWNRALRRLDEHPSMIRDEDLEIVVDDATAVRYLRNNLARGSQYTSDLAEFPRALYDLRRHGWLNGGPAGNEVAWAPTPPMYVGYEIQWGNLSLPSFPSDTLSHGAFYSYMCHDEVPFIDEAALKQAAGDRPWYVDAYVDNPYRAICDRWDVGAAQADPHDPLTSDVPALLFVGQFDPFSPFPLVRQAAKGLSNSWVIKVPNWGRNVLGAAGSECTVNIRNAFIEDPTTLADSSCVEALEPFDSYGHHEFLLPPPPTVSPGPRDAVITTVAGDGALGSSGDGSPATRAQIVPVDVAVDTGGNLYVLEFDGERVRRVDVSSGRISTAVGPPTGIAPPPPGAASAVQFPGATALGIDAQGNLYVGGGLGGDHVITRIDPSGDTTVIAGTGEGGYSGDGGPATQAELSVARDIAVDDQGDVYFTDFFHHRIRKIDTDGVITTVAGTGEKGFSGDGGPATRAQLARPGAIFLDGKGTIYFFDSGNHRIRQIDGDGFISTVAGNGERGCPRHGRAATRASLYGPVVKDAEGNLYVMSENCDRIWKVEADGSFTTVAGTGIPGYSGDGGPAALAELYAPERIALGPDGSLLIADWLNDRVRKVVFP